MKTSAKKISTTADFGDKRLNTRLEKLTNKLSLNLSQPIPQALKVWSEVKAAYRFFDNDKVTSDEIIDAHFESVADNFLAGDEPTRILQLTDTVEFDYTGSRGADNLGCLNYEKRKGVYTHNSLIISDSCTPVGLFQQTHALRPIEYLGNSNERRNLPIEEKESYRWIEHLQAADDLCARYPNTEVVYTADREGDIIELLALPGHENRHLLIRSSHNRKLVDEDLRLREFMDEREADKRYKIKITDPKTQKNRKITVDLKYSKVTIDSNKNYPDGTKIPNVELNVVEVKEVNPKKGRKPVHWIILTTLDVENVAQAKQIIKYYTWRWIVERFHYLLKSGGAKAEELQLGTAHRLLNALSTYSIAAMNVMKIRYVAENQPNTPISELGITPIQHEVLYRWINLNLDKNVKFDPDEVPTTEEFCILLGRLGGFFPSKRHPLPGLKILNRAAAELNTMVDAFLIFVSMN